MRGLRDRVLDALAATWRALPLRARRSVLRSFHPAFLIGVVGVIENERGEILLLEHRFRVPHRWGLPGGFLRSGESLSQALAREVLEETGLVIEVRSEVVDARHYPRAGYATIALAARARARRLKLSPELSGGGFSDPRTPPEGMDPWHAELVRKHLAARYEISRDVPKSSVPPDT